MTLFMHVRDPSGTPDAPRGTPEAHRGTPDAPRGIPDAPKGTPEAHQRHPRRHPGHPGKQADTQVVPEGAEEASREAQVSKTHGFLTIEVVTGWVPGATEAIQEAPDGAFLGVK